MEGQPVDATKVALLVQHIEKDKEVFLTGLHGAIQSHVSGKTPAKCLELVSWGKNYSGSYSSVHWTIWENVPYVERLIAYLRKRPYKENGREYQVDSVLTGEILSLTVDRLSKHVLDHQDMIADIALTEILLCDAAREEFLEVLLAGKASHLLTQKGKSVIAAALLHSLQEKLHHLSASVAANLGEKVSTVLATASKTAVATGSAEIITKLIATTSGKIILTRLSNVIAHSLGPLLTKLLAMPVVEFALKKLIFAAVVGTLAKLIVAKIGMSLGTAIWVVLIPIFLALLAKDIYDLPEKLGRGLAESICTDLRASYSPTITNLITELMIKFTTKEAIQGMATALADDPEVASHVASLISAVSTELAS